ncbi:30S ribosomal protein S5 [Candidatus Micrarchaeota archaeon]|nr:30S ribosomal protein S5 [Candidatus Micrarchaeota archaeon]
MAQYRGGRGERRERRPREEDAKPDWNPKTKLGKMVLAGEITDMEQVYERNLAILEPEIVDRLVPNLKEDVLNIKTVQRTTDSGRRGSFMITAAVGDKNGYVGVGTGKGNEIRPTIERAVREAKKNLMHIDRGCGSWQCGCGEKHSLPSKVHGSFSSVSIDLIPAPKGTGIVAGSTAAKILELAGVKDVWSKTKGSSRTVFNFGKATINALKQTRKMKTKEQ